MGGRKDRRANHATTQPHKTPPTKPIPAHLLAAGDGLDALRRHLHVHRDEPLDVALVILEELLRHDRVLPRVLPEHRLRFCWYLDGVMMALMVCRSVGLGCCWGIGRVLLVIEARRAILRTKSIHNTATPIHPYPPDTPQQNSNSNSNSNAKARQRQRTWTSAWP